VQYYRIPLNPEEAPNEASFDLFLNMLKEMDMGDALVFNCQSGRGKKIAYIPFVIVTGRTTFAMIIASLYMEWKKKLLKLDTEDEDPELSPRRSSTPREDTGNGKSSSNQRKLLFDCITPSR
jgi:hypothetical protein